MQHYYQRPAPPPPLVGGVLAPPRPRLPNFGRQTPPLSVAAGSAMSFAVGVSVGGAVAFAATRSLHPPALTAVGGRAPVAAAGSVRRNPSPLRAASFLSASSSLSLWRRACSSNLARSAAFSAFSLAILSASAASRASFSARTLASSSSLAWAARASSSARTARFSHV